MFNDILTNPVYSIISFALTVVSFILAFVFYYRSQSVKIPCYNKYSRDIISDDMTYFHPIKVSFRGEPVDTLMVTYLVLWNNGRATISKEDIAQADPLRIVAKSGIRILRAIVASESKKANNITVHFNKDKNIALISFDFLDYKNGAILQVYHTGNGDNSEDSPVKTHDFIQISGTIKGTSTIVNTDRPLDVIFGVMNSMDRIFKEMLDRIVPKWYDRVLDYVESRQNILLHALVFMLLFLPLYPFFIIYMASICLIILFMLIIAPFIMYRYSIPKELYRRYKYVTL